MRDKIDNARLVLKASLERVNTFAPLATMKDFDQVLFEVIAEKVQTQLRQTFASMGFEELMIFQRAIAELLPPVVPPSASITPAPVTMPTATSKKRKK